MPVGCIRCSTYTAEQLARLEQLLPVRIGPFTLWASGVIEPVSVSLTGTESRLLGSYLRAYPDAITPACFGPGYGDNMLRVYTSRLRYKLAPYPELSEVRFQPVTGVGARITLHDEEACMTRLTAAQVDVLDTLTVPGAAASGSPLQALPVRVAGQVVGKLHYPALAKLDALGLVHINREPGHVLVTISDTGRQAAAEHHARQRP